MLLSKYLLPTLKETPADAEIISHKYMIRAAMLRKIAPGIYNYLPLCFRVIQKIEQIVREEMNKTDAIELLMPIMTPAELWMQSGRWNVYGKELMRFTDRHEKEYALGPTHEEVITSLVANEIKSYRQLPVCLYQIQSKFRDEVRPRFGVMRAREFVMKDAYSFHTTEKCLDEYYKKMYDAYSNIFKRCGLKFRAVLADSGAIGGDNTHEFMVLANSGESRVISCSNDKCGYAATDETADSVILRPVKEEPAELKKIFTPGKKTIEEVSGFLGIEPCKLVKTLLYKADGNVIAALIRGDRDVNEIKLKKIINANEIELADADTVSKITGCAVGFAGPVNLKNIKIIADNSLKNLNNFAVGANENDAHFVNVNYNRDFEIEKFYDIRLANKGDKCIKCGAELEDYRGIEVGQIFKLGKKYSESMNAVYTAEDGKLKNYIMGCYGIGITRIVAAAIEQNYDDKGIIWTLGIAPFSVIVIGLNKPDTKEFQIAKDIYEELKKAGVEVLFDDRNVSPGFKFKDADLIGIPYQIIVGQKSLVNNSVEICVRKTGEKISVDRNEIGKKIFEFLKESN
ncbi:proline--tRNA ligase [Candidatus Dependentiae bacterium]|nr:proline--tRNA ligase [Candidatus Dependentiae bacterium]